MLESLKNKFDLKKYKSIMRGSEIEKVSFFFKDGLEEMKNKKILFLDLEFSQKRTIYELGGFIFNAGKIENHFYKEYSLPYGEKVWDFDKNMYVFATNINKGKPKFEKDDLDFLMNSIDSVDYIVIHNYVAELTCIHKLLFKDKEYNKHNVPFFNEGKVICTNYTFNNKYFKNLSLDKFNNSEVSKNLGWEVIEDSESIYCLHNKLDIKFKIKKPIEVVGKLHNSYYDSAITLTNFYSLMFLIK